MSKSRPKFPSPEACEKAEDAFERAKRKKKAARIFSKERRESRREQRSYRDTLRQCRKSRRGRPTRFFVRGLARAAKDAGVKFKLKPGFSKGYKLKPRQLNKIMMSALKVKDQDDIFPAAWKFAKKNGILEPTKYAVMIEVLKDAEKAAKGSAIAAQVALVVLDVLASIFTLGGYAAAAPAVHAGAAAGAQISIAKIQSDRKAAEMKYRGFFDKKRAKADAKAAAEEAAAAEAAAQEAEEEAAEQLTALQEAPPPKPWYQHPAVWGTGVVLLLAGIGTAVWKAKQDEVPRG